MVPLALGAFVGWFQIGNNMVSARVYYICTCELIHVVQPTHASSPIFVIPESARTPCVINKSSIHAMPIQNVNPIGSRDPCLYTLPLSLLPDRSKRDRIVVALEKKKTTIERKKIYQVIVQHGMWRPFLCTRFTFLDRFKFCLENTYLATISSIVVVFLVSL